VYLLLWLPMHRRHCCNCCSLRGAVFLTPQPTSAAVDTMAITFRTYRDAHVALRIPGSHMVGTQGTPRTGVRSLKLTCHDDSRDELLDGGATIM